ncbi:calcium-dependent protein kinase 29 [Nicotiana attenuata]|uniref:Calcium-dependent protein kinase 29 n=1 Tax=Nicotiana attenuata TaxID=49451 RepID=A0A314LFD6_NICAT|nr:calcium-dependent protein kinase 29 [Nicotiana attenuata]
MMFLSRFSSDGNPDSWIFRAELYFTYLGFCKKDWLPLPSFYLEGDALAWFNWLFHNNQLYDWNHFKEKFLLHFHKHTFTDSSRMAVTSQVDYLNCATLVPPVTYESTSTQISEIHKPNACLVDADKNATVVDELFDKTPQSTAPDMHSQFSKDEAQLVPLVGHDYFMPKEMERFEILSIESEELLDAMKINYDSDDGKSEEDQRDYTQVEENSSNSADQAFPTSPQLDTATQLSYIATMILDPFSSLIPGDKFLIGQTLIVPVSINLDDRHILDICYCCHTWACASLDYVSGSPIGTIPFYSCVDNWFDTRKAFKDDSSHDKKFTMANEVLATKNVVPAEIFLIESEIPAWVEEFALIIKQSPLHDFQLVVLSCIVLHLEWLEWKIVEVVRISNISYSRDAIGLLVRRDNLQHHSVPTSYEDMFSMHLVMEICVGGELFNGTIARGYSIDKEAADIFGELLTVIHNCHFMGGMRKDFKLEKPSMWTNYIFFVPCDLVMYDIFRVLDDYWNHSLVGHSEKVYPHHGLKLAQRLEKLPCTLSACICGQFINRSIFNSRSALGHASLLITLHQFFLEQFGLEFLFDPGTSFLASSHRVTRNCVFWDALGNLKPNKFIPSTLWTSYITLLTIQWRYTVDAYEGVTTNSVGKNVLIEVVIGGLDANYASNDGTLRRLGQMHVQHLF